LDAALVAEIMSHPDIVKSERDILALMNDEQSYVDETAEVPEGETA
jgi:hypothetical protein